MDRIGKQWLQALAQGPLSVYRLLDVQDASLPEGQALAREWGAFTEDVRCPHCHGTGYRWGPRLDAAFQKYLDITRSRPSAAAQYDQGFISPEGVMQRVAFLYERGDLLGGGRADRASQRHHRHRH